MCGEDPDPTPHVNVEDVTKDNALDGGVRGSDGDAALKDKRGDVPTRVWASLEQFDGRTFDPEWNNHTDAFEKDAIPPSVDTAWRTLGNNLRDAVRDFEQALTNLKGRDYWEGKTIDAAYENAKNSTGEPYFIGAAALRGAELTRKFRDTLNYVYDNLHQDPRDNSRTLWQTYQEDLSPDTEYVTTVTPHYVTSTPVTTTPDAERIKRDYNEYMRAVMEDSYIQGLTDIYNHYPPFVMSDATEPPGEIPGLPKGPGDDGGTGGDRTTAGGGGGTQPFGGDGLPPGGGGASIPKSPETPLPDGLPDQTQLPGDPNNPGQSTDPGQNGQRPSPTDPSQAMGQAGGLANAANQAIGAATQAAKAQPGGAPKNAGQKPNLPREGALRLGNEGKGAPSSGARGGGAGGGAGLGGAPKGLPSGVPGMPAAATQASAAGASGPGMGAGSPMMGPPGTPGSAGHGAGGAQQGKEHKVNKALRSRRHGVEIAGEAEAVVPVVGADQEQDQEQDEAAAQRSPDRPRRPSTPSPSTPVSAAESEGRQLRGRS